MPTLTLILLPQRLAVCRLDAAVPVPAWAAGGPFFSITRTPDELSVVCDENRVPGDVKCEVGWRGLKIEGPLAFSQTGILASVAAPLAGAGISLFAIATYDTDYVLVKMEVLSDALAVLSSAGHQIRDSHDL